MFNGWAGYNLEINLSQGKVEKEESNPKLAEADLGGRSTSVNFASSVIAKVSAYEHRQSQ